LPNYSGSRVEIPKFSLPIYHGIKGIKLTPLLGRYWKHKLVQDSWLHLL